MSLTLPDLARGTHLHQMLVPQIDVLALAQPVDWVGFIGEDPAPSVAADRRTYTPQFCGRYQIAARRGMKAKLEALFTPGPDVGQWYVWPTILAFPQTAVSINGRSLFEVPIVTANAGDKVFLRCTWNVQPQGLLSSSNASLIIARGDLDLQNEPAEAFPVQAPFTRTWHHAMGVFTAEGAWSAAAVSFPFLPPELNQ